MDLGLIRQSTSPWASPVLMIRKPDGGIRFCVDYRKLNAVTVKDCYPMPLIDDLLDVLGNSKLFSTMDVASGYWNVPMHEDSIGRTAFTCKFGLYEWLVMPFGLCNAVPAFERLMENVLIDLKWRICLVYLDDCVIFSEDFPSHLKRIRQVLNRFRDAGFKLKMSKCHWGKDHVTFLGHIISPRGILPNPEKVKAVLTADRPSDLSTLRAFLGLASYFRRYVKGYALIASPLENLKKKDAPFLWNDECEEAFCRLQVLLSSPPILTYPDFNKRFKLYVDSSHVAVGACLMQDGKDRVVAYASKTLSSSQKNWIHKTNGISEIECWGIIWATRKFRCYIDKNEFDIFTDHKALTWIFGEGSRTGNSKLARWAMELSQLQYKIYYRPGPSLGHVDGLSRMHINAVTRSQSPRYGPSSASSSSDIIDSDAGSSSQSSNQSLMGLDIDTLVEEQRKIPWIVSIIAYKEHGALPIDPQLRRSMLSMESKYLVRGEVLHRRILLQTGLRVAREIQVPVIPLPLIESVLYYCHNDILAAHLGEKKTLEKVRTHAYWIGWRKDTIEYVKACRTCHKGKGYRPWRAGRMQHMPVYSLSGPFSLLVVDAVGPLPPTANGDRYILVFVDYFTRWVEAFPVANLDTQSFVKCLMDGIVSRFGVPEQLLSDRGTNFVSNLAQSFYDTLGIRKLTSTAYHPQTQGLVERFNATLISMLKTYVNEQQTDWDVYLPRVLFAYRTSYHETLQDSPFFSLFGRDPKLPLDVMFLDVGHDWMSDEISLYRRGLASSLRDTRRLVERQLIKGQFRNEKRLNKQKEVVYDIGDPVWIYQYFRRTQDPNDHRIKKLASSWHGPFRIVGQISQNAYQVEIPSHPDRIVSINVNRLKKYRGRWSRPLPDEEPLPENDDVSDSSLDDQLEVTDLPESSFISEIIVGNDEEIALTNAHHVIVEVVDKRRNKQNQVEYLVTLASGNRYWIPREYLESYRDLYLEYEDQLRAHKGLPPLRRSYRGPKAGLPVENAFLF